MNKLIIIICLLLSFEGFSQTISKIREKKDYTISPSYRYINAKNHLLGIIYTNVNWYEELAIDSLKRFNYLVETYYGLKSKNINGLGAVSYRFDTKGVFKAIEPILAIRRFATFTNLDKNYVLDYNKYRLSAKFHLNKTLDNESSITISRIGIAEKFANFTSANDFTFDHLNTNINRISFSKENNYDDAYWRSFDIVIDNVSYENPFKVKKKFTRMDINYFNAWTISECKVFSINLYGGYFLQNDNRNVSSFSNELVKGSIALSQQGFNDYAYDENFVSRRNTNDFWDNQISTAGGGFKFAPSNNNALGLTNDYAFALNADVNLPGTGKVIKTHAYLDIGGYKSGTMKYLYSSGLKLSIRNICAIYLPIINSGAINQNYKDNKLSFLERINYQLKFSHHFTGKT